MHNQLENLIGFQGEIDSKTDLLKAILDLNPNCIFIKNKKGEYLLANNASAKVAGLEDGNDMIGKSDKDLPYLKERAESFLEDDNTILSQGIDIKLSKDKVIDSKGNVSWYQVIKKPIKNKEGEIVLILGVATDITEKIRTQEMMKRKLEELQVYIDSNSELMRFASVASHDLKEPLRQIYNFSNLLRDENLSEKGTTFLERIYTTSSQMLDLVDDLLEYAKIDSLDIKKTKVEIGSVLKKVEQNLSLLIIQSEAKICIEKMPIIYGVESHFIQLFQNLISNGLKFRKEKDYPQIVIKYSREGEQHKFSVIDNGIGIKTDNHKEIFEVFKRLHSKKEYEGTGIGLATCKKIVERYGGHISIDRNHTNGAKFDFIIFDK